MSAEFSSHPISSLGKPLLNAEVVQRRVRIQSVLTVLCAVAILAVSGYRALRSGKSSDALSAQTVAGTWELQSISGQTIGEKSRSGVVLQRISLRDGRISGETHLKPSADAAQPLPFPDESVSKVNTEPNGNTLVRWNGTYSVVDGKRFALQIGKAAFFIPAHRNPQTLLLSCDNDLILTAQGTAVYRPIK